MNIRRISLRFAVIALAAVMAVAAFAQDQGQGTQGQGRQGRQGGAQRGQRQGGMMGRQGQSGVMLLMRADVQKDLGITDDQKTKITELMGSMRGQGGQRQRGQRGQGTGAATGTATGNGAAGATGSGANVADQQAARDAAQKARAEMQTKVEAILTPDQNKRLKEIGIQLQGAGAVNNPEVQKELNITADQKTKITDLETKMREANQALMEKQRSQELTREQVTESRKKNADTLNAEIAKILTSDQNAKLKAMAGKPFVADPASATGGRLGGRGGRGGNGGGATGGGTTGGGGGF